jgi:phosphatidylglycerophosphate synthase
MSSIHAEPAAFRDTVRRLSAAQKPAARSAPAYSRFVNRRIGRVLAAGSFHLGLTPNHVTAVSAAFTAAGIALVALATPTPLVALLVTLALLVGYAFDSADGQLARLRGGGSPAGEWLDHVVDSVKCSALHLAVLICWFRSYDLPGPALLLIPIGFTLVQAVFFFVQILTDQLRRAHPERPMVVAGSGAGAVLRSVLVAPTLAWPPVFEVVYTLMLAGTALFLLAALPKWYREMVRLPTA